MRICDNVEAFPWWGRECIWHTTNHKLMRNKKFCIRCDAEQDTRPKKKRWSKKKIQLMRKGIKT